MKLIKLVVGLGAAALAYKHRAYIAGAAETAAREVSARTHNLARGRGFMRDDEVSEAERAEQAKKIASATAGGCGCDGGEHEHA